MSFVTQTEKAMKKISAWSWKEIWQALGVLAILLSMAYSPYLLLSGRLDRIEDTMNRRLEAMDRKMDSRFEAMDRKMDSRFEAMDRKMDSRFEAIDRRFEAIDNKLANIDKRLAVVEDRVGVTAQHVPVRPDSALAPRMGATPAAVSVLDEEPVPLSGRLSRRFAFAGARLLCDILPVVPGGAFLQTGYARSCQSCAIGANA